MSTNTSVLTGDILAANGTSTLSGYNASWSGHSNSVRYGQGTSGGRGDDDDATPYTSGSGTFYHHYICANSCEFYVNAAYDFWGSDNIWVSFYRYSISQGAWVNLYYYYYMDGNGGNGYTGSGKQGWFGANSPNYSSRTWRSHYSGNDSIHFDLVTGRRYWGWGNDKGSYGYLYMGDYNSCTAYSGMKDTLLYGKSGSSVTAGISNHQGYSWSYSVSSHTYSRNELWLLYCDPSRHCSNPFNTTWGNITTSAGSTILSSDAPYIALSIGS